MCFILTHIFRLQKLTRTSDITITSLLQKQQLKIPYAILHFIFIVENITFLQSRRGLPQRS